MDHLVSTKTALHQAINHIERLSEGRNSPTSYSLTGFPHAVLALRLGLSAAVGRKQPTCFLSETFTPDRAALHMLCLKARVSFAEIALPEIEEADVTRLSYAAAKISAAPLHFATYAPFDIEEIARDLFPMASGHGLQVVVCEKRTAEHLDDWRSELEFLSKISSVEVHLLAGQIPEAPRFAPGFGQKA